MASICFIAVAVTFYLNSRTSAPPAPVRPASDSLPSASGDAERMWAEMVRSEELIFDFSETMLQLSFAVRNLDLPDERTRPLFWPILSVTDLAPLPDAVAAGMDFSLRSWPVAPPSGDLAGRDLKLWPPAGHESVGILLRPRRFAARDNEMDGLFGSKGFVVAQVFQPVQKDETVR